MSWASSAPTVIPAARPAPPSTWLATTTLRVRLCSCSRCSSDMCVNPLITASATPLLPRYLNCSLLYEERAAKKTLGETEPGQPGAEAQAHRSASCARRCAATQAPETHPVFVRKLNQRRCCRRSDHRIRSHARTTSSAAQTCRG